MQQRTRQHQSQQLFTASEVAEFEYCPLVWWHEKFEPAVQADTEELFARLVELEHDHDTQAPALPEYQMLEQLLVRRGAFEEGRQQHLEHAEEVAEIQEERVETPTARSRTRLLVWIAVGIVVLALLLLLLSMVLR